MYWFDTTAGKLVVGEAAYEDQTHERDPAEVPVLAHLLTREDFGVDYTDYDRYPRKKQSRDACLEYGKWVIKVLSESSEPVVPTREHFERMSRLGLGMAWTAMRRPFGDYWGVVEALGVAHFRPPHTFDTWTKEDAVQTASQLANQLGRKPTVSDYREWAKEGYMPGIFILRERIGMSIDELNDRIGFPNVKQWSRDDYVAWGSRVLAANPGKELSQHLITILSTRKRGPSFSLVWREFGSREAFAQEVASFDQTSAVASETFGPLSRSVTVRLDALARHFGDNFPEKRKDQLGIVGRFEVARQLIPGLKNSEYAQIAAETTNQTFVERCIEENYYLNEAAIVACAAKAGVEKYIELAPHDEPLHVDEADIVALRNKLSNVRRTCWQKSRQGLRTK